MSQQLNLNDPSLRQNPYPIYKIFRESEPVFWSESLQAWIFFKYDDIHTLLQEPRVVARRHHTWLNLAPPERREQLQPVIEVLSRWLLFFDGSDHTRLRKLMNQGFAPKVIEGLLPTIQGVATNLVEQLASQRQFDAASQFAHLQPVIVISNMLGVHPTDYGKVQQWSDDISYFFTSIPIPSDACDGVIVSIFEMIDYLKDVVAERRAMPQDDFLSVLIHAEEDGDVIHAEDLFANLVLLLMAGHETTRNLIGNAIHLLLMHPNMLQSVKLDAFFWDKVIDETLRFDSPVQILSRLAGEDLEVRGQPIRQGQPLFLVLGSGNHDPAHFADGDRFDIERH
ncbi:MAG: cytochrome P450, partial [Chroococcidiopsidaceae cyanobacterium CP_BM_ER_R8_30]|nr:cytochrome P450 [Chroococcidiopsidaceae cyanobacterium CP_BM_ER_R8_30]